MAVVAPSRPIPVDGRHLTVRGRDIPVVLPSRRDLRLKLSLVIIGLQILGQTVLRFKISIAQIVVTVAVCGIIELVVTLHRERILAWPASAFQTGNSVAFILRASGTRHGDLWSLRGVQFFVLAAVLSMLSKYVVRPNGRHLFNPSNIGIVAVLLVVGPEYVFSEHLWWGPFGVSVGLAVALIGFGGWWLLRPVRMVEMAAAFLVTFAVLIALLAVGGRSFYATWRPTPIRGMSYWLNIALSPELVAYVFFMMSDPQTAPKSRLGRVMYGVATAVVTTVLILFQTTEFGIKTAILASLTVTCALVPLTEYVSRRLSRAGDRAGAVPLPGVKPSFRRLAKAARRPVVIAAIMIGVAAPLDTAALKANKAVVLIERDLPAPGDVVANAPVQHNRHRQ
jgi:Na+-transporting NADH:ubiquinone oxidoreductase subunit NqrB